MTRRGVNFMLEEKESGRTREREDLLNPLLLALSKGN